MTRIVIIGFLLTSILSCTKVQDKGIHFTLVTRLPFSNSNSGIGVGDFNRDGLPDLFFAGNKTSSRLYLNHGDFHFEDITQKACVGTEAWCTGVSIVDINNDGWPDIYVCVSGSKKNLLFINQHDNTFKEEAEAYGLADTSNSTQAVFFDYDHDGKLDMYLVTDSADKLYHNEGSQKTHPLFKDVSRQAGIIEDGSGLGVVLGDFNNDGWPDIYVGNVDSRNDLLWQNNKDGTFTNVIATAIRHQSLSSSGVDAADLNNDGFADIITLDRQKAGLTNQLHQTLMDRGYQPQYEHNMLQLNNGVRNINPRQGPGEAPPVPFFSEIAAMAGIAKTDSPWSVLIADFDNDGWKDIYVTDHLYRNTGGFLFEDTDTGMPGPARIPGTAGTGAVYADLDNDGNLDLIINKSDGPAEIRRNESKRNNYLTLRLIGDSNNTDGIGATVYAYTKTKYQMITQYPVKGYCSSVDSRLHIGLGNDSLDSIKISWPDGREQLIFHPAINTILTIDYKNAQPDPPAIEHASPKMFVDVTKQEKTDFQHKETFFSDYLFQPAILQKYSQEGPFISKGDLNGDGLEDFFIGGAFKQSGKLFYQNKDGTFTGRDLITGNKYEEDMQSAIFDANGDNYPDLLVLGGSSEFDDNSSFYCPRLYLNDGRGNLRLDSTAFASDLRTPAKCVAIADLDGDGQKDIFIGGRVSLSIWPRSSPSYILHNEHGHFVDITAKYCPALKNAGMLNAALFADLDGDGRPELILAGDGQPIRVFHNEGKTLREITAAVDLDKSSGFWRSLLVTDINRDGHPDIVAGNLGLNKLSVEQSAGPHQVHEWRSGYFENNGHDHFSFHPFPLLAQIAPVNAIVCTDVDHDGYPDLILAGNEYQAAVRTGRYDASYGLLLKADGHGNFQPIAAAEDGLLLDGDVKDIKLINAGGHTYLLTAINDQPMRVYRLMGSAPP